MAKRAKRKGKGSKKGGKWIQGAIKHPGALRATAKKKGLVKGDEPLSGADLKKLAKSGGPKTKKRVALARTLKKMRKKKK
jgi:hypothetical protein